MQAIETVYRGVKFRSRLEARWATFFDEMMIDFLYEPKAFRVEQMNRNYVPDFYLTETKTWVEVNPDLLSLDESVWEMYLHLIDGGSDLDFIDESSLTEHGLLLLSDIPSRDINAPFAVPLHPILQHHKGPWMGFVQFIVGGVFITGCEEPVYSKIACCEAIEKHRTIDNSMCDEDILFEAYRRAKYARFA